MQSIIRSINNCKKITNKSNFIIVRNYTSNNNNEDRIKSFEEFKKERDLLKKKSELVEKLTQLRIAGGVNSSEQVLELSKEIKSIEKQLDPSLVRFSVQSKLQKEKEVEQWKLFIEKKGIKSKSELKNINRFEFERFKNTGYLDNQQEQNQKVEQQKQLERIYRESKAQDIEESVVLKDPYKFDISSASLSTSKDLIGETFRKFEKNIKENQQFKDLALNFLDTSIPLSDKLIFKNQEQINDSDLEKFTEEEYRQFKKDLKALYQLENSGKQTLETNLRNIQFLQEQLRNYIDENGNIDFESFQKNPFIIENSFSNKFHPDRKSLTPHTLLTPDGFVPLENDSELKVISQSEFPNSLSDESVLKKLQKAEEKYAENDNQLSEDSEELNTDEELEELDLADKETLAEVFDKEDEYEPGKQPFESAVELAEDERPEFSDEDMVSGNLVSSPKDLSEDQVDTENMTPEELMEQQLVIDGHIKDNETLSKHDKENPEYASSWALNNITKQIKNQLEEERLEKLEQEDPLLVRNFIKYKVDIEREQAKKRAEEESRKYTMAMAAIERDVIQSLDQEPKPNTVYNRKTGKVHIPKKKHSNCLLCQDPNWELNPLNVPFLTLYVTSEGDLLPRAFSGNCLKHQKKIAKTFKHAKSLGLFNYKNGEFAVEDPNVYSLSKSEMEEYRKWYMGDYSKEEWEEVIDEFGELEEDEDEEDLLDEEEVEEQPQQLQQPQQKEDVLLVDDIKAEYGVETKEMFNYRTAEKK